MKLTRDQRVNISIVVLLLMTAIASIPGVLPNASQHKAAPAKYSQHQK